MNTADNIASLAAVIFTIQTGLLWWYATETRKLRLDAADQNKLINEQIANASKQNLLMADQLKVMADGLQFQRECIEQEDEPCLEVAVILKDSQCCKIEVVNIKENVHFTEFRTNEAHAGCCFTEQHRRHFLFAGGSDRNIYLAVVYKTYRGKVNAKSYHLFTGDITNQIKEEKTEYRHWRVIGYPTL